MSSTADTADRLDTVREELIAKLSHELGDGLVEHLHKPGDDLWVRVRTDDWVRAGLVMRDALGFEYFTFLSGIDWMPSPFGRGEDDPTAPPPERDATVRQGVTGGDTRFQVFARVFHLGLGLGVTLKVDVPDDDPHLASWVSVYRGADWHERECWEMYGIRFDGHPNLTHIYLPGGFEGFPLRKDFPLLARMLKPWPGIVDVEPMPGGDDEGGE